MRITLAKPDEHMFTAEIINVCSARTATALASQRITITPSDGPMSTFPTHPTTLARYFYILDKQCQVEVSNNLQADSVYCQEIKLQPPSTQTTQH